MSWEIDPKTIKDEAIALEVMEMNTMQKAAIWYVEKHGISVIPVGSNKAPLVKWTEFQTRRATKEEILAWPEFPRLAIVTGRISNLVIVDCDSREIAKRFFLNQMEKQGSTPVVVATRRGFHFWFRHPGDVDVRNYQPQDWSTEDQQYEIKGDRGCATAPPSIHADGCYRWWRRDGLSRRLTTVDALPVFKHSWRPECPTRPQEPSGDVRDPVAYIKTITSVEGEGGDLALFRAASTLVESGMPSDRAVTELLAWNQTNADPPWSEADLLQKLTYAFQRRS